MRPRRYDAELSGIRCSAALKARLEAVRDFRECDLADVQREALAIGIVQIESTLPKGNQ